MHRFPENVFLLSLRQDHFTNSARTFLGPTAPFLYFKNSDIFTQIQQKPSYQTPAVARFRNTYAATSRKYVSTEP